MNDLIINSYFYKDLFLFQLTERNFSKLGSFISSVFNNYKNIINLCLKEILQKEFNNKELKIFIKILLWLFGVSIAIYFFAVINQIKKEINLIWVRFELNHLKFHTLSNKKHNFFIWHYWTSILFILVKSNKYNIF